MESWADAYENGDDSLPPIPLQWLEDAKNSEDYNWTVVDNKKKSKLRR